MRLDWAALIRGESISFGGARLGDPLDKIPFADVTMIEPRGNHASRGYKEGKVWHVEGDVWTEIPRDELMRELYEFGGRAYVERSGFEVTDGVISHIWIRGAPLGDLPVRALGDIERLFGKPLGIERTLGWLIHHYPERGLSVAWHASEGRVEHVAFGPVVWKPRLFGARDVLYEYLSAAPRLREWTEPRDRNTSAWVRWARVRSLLRAFTLGTPEEFAEGKFLDGKKLEDYPLAAAAVTRSWRDREPAREPLGRLFWWLLVYRGEAENTLRLNSGWLEAGHPGILTALRVTGQANGRIGAALEEIEMLLCEMIAPDGKTWGEAEMVARFEWPEVDLAKLEGDEL
jgi:hypothetical protein